MTDSENDHRVNATPDVGTWPGRRQAFALIAGTCAAADAKCLHELREKKQYKTLGMSWQQFCKERLGIQRSKADEVIRRWDEFGPNYFTLAQATHITAEEYRRIRGAISGKTLLLGGERIPIEPENAPRLAAAIAELRRAAEPDTAASPAAVLSTASIGAASRAAMPRAAVRRDPALEAARAFDQAERALRSALRDLAEVDAARLDMGSRLHLRTLLGDSVDKLRRLEQSIRV